jgi:hypothetical protein
MGIKNVLNVLFMAAILVSLLPSAAVSQVKEIPPPDTSIRYTLAEALTKGVGVCEVVAQLIKDGMSAAQVVENAILMGHPPCIVVRCAIDAGGKLEDVITAAFRANATSDVIITCCMLAGIPVDALARILECRGYPCLWDDVVRSTPATVGGGGSDISASPFRP